MKSAESLFDKYGTRAILIAAVTPVPYKVFTILAGILRLDLKRFILASLVGRGARFLSLALLLFLFGEEIQGFINDNFQKLSLLAGLAILGSFLSIWILLKIRTHPPESE